jgi:hypothetical protein
VLCQNFTEFVCLLQSNGNQLLATNELFSQQGRVFTWDTLEWIEILVYVTN